ncbi:hypothetical protein ACSBR1_017721 [Camellia fascicularis]
MVTSLSQFVFRAVTEKFVLLCFFVAYKARDSNLKVHFKVGCGIKFGLATCQEICTSSNSDFPISHASQLSNPFLGLPLESGKCESCGAAEPGTCEGHFGYMELPIPVYHPSHVSELKRLLSLVCFKCLKLRSGKMILDKQMWIYNFLTNTGGHCFYISICIYSGLNKLIWLFMYYVWI